MTCDNTHGKNTRHKSVMGICASCEPQLCLTPIKCGDSNRNHDCKPAPDTRPPVEIGLFRGFTMRFLTTPRRGCFASGRA
jgi:hypothetical protein